MKNFSLFARKPQPTVSDVAARRSPTLLDPKDFKHVGGGGRLPNNTWGQTVDGKMLPNNTW